MSRPEGRATPAVERVPSAEMPLRVVVVHNRYRSEQPSGEDRVVDQEMELLAAAGHEVELFGRRSDDIASMSLPRKALVPLQVPWNGKVRAELAALLRASRPDVVHIHSTFPLLSPSVVAACRDAGIPAVATLHNYGLVCATGTMYRNGRHCTDCASTRAAAAVIHGCYRGSRLASVPVAIGLAVNRDRWLTGIDRFFCISDAQRHLLVGAGIPGAALVVRHNMVPEPEVRRQGPGEHVLYVGRLTQEKGVRLLMEAWDRLADIGEPGLPLVVAGAGPLDGEVARWAAHRSDVRLVGLQTRRQCTELTARAAAVVTPSVWPEAFGLVAVEAMAAGVPCVASATGAFVEVVDDGVTGILHSPGDVASLAAAVAHVVGSPAVNARMGVAARERYERMFAPPVGLAALVGQYRSVIAAASA